MGQVPETRLTNRVRIALKAAYPDAIVLKLAGGMVQLAGLPDLLVIRRGHAIWLEVKARQPGESDAHARGRTSPRQAEMHARLRRAGSTVAVVLEVAEALTVVANSDAQSEVTVADKLARHANTHRTLTEDEDEA